MSDLEDPYLEVGEPPDERELEARDALRGFFQNNREKVFFSRQLVVLYEDTYFHRLQDRDEFSLKINLCKWLGVTPVFVCRMLPRSWIFELNRIGGFSLILKYQLYPWTHKDLARRVKAELGLPVDAPRFLYEGTMNRFLKWHSRRELR